MSLEQLESPHAYVAQLFLSFFGRAAEYEALNYYTNRLATLQDENGFAFQDAYKALTTEIYLTGQLNDEQPSGEAYSHRAYVSDLYANVLGRDPADDLAGWEYWTGTLERGENSVESLLAVFLASARDSARDSDYLANRTLVALEFAREENSGPQVLATLEFDAKMILDGVNEDPATVVAAQARLLTPDVPTLVLQASNWTAGTNTFEITLEYQSDLVFDKVGMDGSYTLSSALSSTTENGVTSMTLSGQISNRQENGVLKLIFKAVNTSLEGREVLIKQLDINGSKLHDVSYPLDVPGYALAVDNDPLVTAQNLSFPQASLTVDLAVRTSIDPDLPDDFLVAESFRIDEDEPHFGSYDDADNPGADANFADNLPFEETPSSLGGDLDDFI